MPLGSVPGLNVKVAVPVAAYGGFRFLRRVTGSRPAALWGGVAYGLLPVLTGAVQQGRLGTVAASLVLPWLAHAALFLAPGETQDRRVRAAWRTIPSPADLNTAPSRLGPAWAPRTCVPFSEIACAQHIVVDAA